MACIAAAGHWAASLGWHSTRTAGQQETTIHDIPIICCYIILYCYIIRCYGSYARAVVLRFESFNTRRKSGLHFVCMYD